MKTNNLISRLSSSIGLFVITIFLTSTVTVGDVFVMTKDSDYLTLHSETTETEQPAGVDISLGNGTTYYYDATNGNDSNNGTSEETPLKTINKFGNIKLYPGDNVLFKRGEVWEGARLINFYYPSGTKEAPILYSSYGDKNKPRPVITSIKDQDLTWIKSNEENIWYVTSLTNNPRRLFKNGNEILNARSMEEISLGQSWYHTYEEDRLYVHSVTDPNNDTFRFSYATTCYLQNQEYIIINNLDLQGGTSLKIVGSSNIHILNSKIGLYSSYGLTLSGNTQTPRAQNNIIENNIFDSGFTLDYNWISAGGAGADYIGSNDGITLGEGAEYSKVYNNYFKNWNHASIGMETTSTFGIHHNEIYNNTMTAPDVAYGGRIALSGNAYENILHHNLIKNINVANQIRGHHNHIHHNIIDGVKNSPIKDGNIGQCLSMSPSTGNVYNNLFEYNSLKNCDGAGIYINSYDTDSKDTIYDNIFRNNIIENNGENDIKLTRGAGYQIFKDNYITSDTINYERTYRSVADFNLINDNISNNTNIMPTDSSVGAGSQIHIGSTLIY